MLHLHMERQEGYRYMPYEKIAPPPYQIHDEQWQFN